MRAERMLQVGCGLLALSLLLALALSGGQPADPAAAALLSWVQGLLLVLGAGLLVGSIVVRALTPPVTIEQVVQDWYEDS